LKIDRYREGQKTERICYLANASSVHTHRWAKYFVERGHEIHVVSFENGQIPGAIVHVLKLPVLVKSATYPLKIASVYRIRALIKRIGPDILHAHYITNYGLFGSLCNFNPFVLTAWGSDVFVVPGEHLVSTVKKYIAAYTLSKADLVTTDSISAVRKIISLGVDEKKVKLIIHGVDLRVFHPAENKEELKKDLRLPESRQVVISSRNLEPVYDVATLIRAVPYVIKKCPNSYFLIVGDGTLRRQLEDLTRRLGVTEYVRFIGSVSNEDMPRFLGLSDVYVSTSLSDTRSVSMLEAMACMLPVVVTDLMGNRESVEDGANGFIFSQKDSQKLAERIVYLLRDDETMRRFGVINRKYVEKEANYQKEMRKMEELYEGLVGA
jgi:glycosyltransferase involved in cell wall biosynthesis